ncbi:MAG: serine hydrolase [Bacteroidota bacterium]
MDRPGANPEGPRIQEIDAFAERILNRYGLPGLSLAIQRDGALIHRAHYGFANLEHQVPVSDSSVFRVYSLTKITVATAVFQLIEAGRLTADDQIGRHLADLPESWQSIQVKHLLAHASGLPDMDIFTYQDLDEEAAKATVYAAPLVGEPGQRYQYNQTNYWLLARLIEAVGGEAMEDVVLDRQFPDAAGQAFFSSDSRQVIPNRATAYFPFFTGQRTIEVPYLGAYMHSANGLNLTSAQFLNWSTRLLDYELLEPASLEAMWSPFPYAEADPASFAHGWEIHETNGVPSYGFSGSLVTALRLFPEQDLVILFLANGMGSFFNIEVPVSYLAGLVDPDLVDPEIYVYETLTEAFAEGDLAEAPARYQALRTDPMFAAVDFRNLMRIIINVLRDGGQLDRALAAAQHNREQFPESWMVYDQLGKVQQLQGQRDAAISNYRQALALNPESSHSREQLQVLQAE